MDPKTTALFGGEKLTVSLRDGSTEEVNVAILTVRQFPTLAACIEDEPSKVELYAGKPKGWSDALSPEGFEKIIEKGDELNADFFFRWALRINAQRERLMPGITDKLVSASLSGLQKSQSNSDGRATNA